MLSRGISGVLLVHDFSQHRWAERTPYRTPEWCKLEHSVCFSIFMA